MKKIKVKVNGKEYVKDIPEYKTLLDFLREDLFLTGTKRGCGAGECGACTVILNGRAVNSCLVLAVECDGAEIKTIEGEGENGKLSPLQEAFQHHHAVQCGFCTPGMVMSARSLLDRVPHPTEEEIKEAIEGNFCRCTGYKQIVEAIIDASRGGS
ncbi:MAG TPA: (2Fe-2S)-binding protein [Candidatus Eremiobacteraeota bacterium]|nr:MAG: Carbon monoxide dehydrogenase small chain [bacterium ADurb.Bin363]HPZ10044.1 (2Fe-2S)-binding protein [Candidatus Eremiobacteraeota bacterium]